MKSRSVDYHKVLREVARNLVRLKRPERLLKMITRFLPRGLGLTHATILVLDSRKSRYTVFDSRGVKRIPRLLVRFEAHHPLVQWFLSKDRETEFLRTHLSRQQIQSALRDGNFARHRPEIHRELVKLERTFKDLRVDIAVPGHFKKSLVGILLLGEKLSRRLFTQTEIHFFQALVHDMALAVKTAEYHERLKEKSAELEAKKNELEVGLQEIERLRKKEQDTYYEIIKSLAQEIYAKDAYTFGHIHQVEQLGFLTADELGLKLNAKRRTMLSAGLLLHDVGKIGIPDHILNKPVALDPEEWRVMRTHVEKGVKILESLTDFKEAAEIVHCHHERWDGKGYPRGLRGDEIPIEARIVSVVDTFHAIISNRCYRRARSVETAFEELRHSAHTQFDPRVVEAFIRGMKKSRKMV